MSDGPMDQFPQRMCPTCKVNTLRRGEKHLDCFDCLDHGPLTMPDLRCLLCKGWQANKFVAATLRYAPESEAKAQALELQARDVEKEKDKHPSSPHKEMDVEVSGAPLEIPLMAPTPTPPPPPGFPMVSQADLTKTIVDVLTQLGVVPVGGKSTGTKQTDGEVSPSSSSNSAAKKSKKNRKRRPSASVGTDPSKQTAVKKGQSSSASVTPVVAESRAPSLPRYAFEEASTAGVDNASPIPPAVGGMDVSGIPRSAVDRRRLLFPSLTAEDQQAMLGREYGRQTHAHQQADRSLSDHTNMTDAIQVAAQPNWCRQNQQGVVLQDSTTGLATARVTVPQPSIVNAMLPHSIHHDTSMDSVVSRSGDDRSQTGEAPSMMEIDDSDREESAGDQSNFRWAVESVSALMGLPIKSTPKVTGSGRFSTAPTKEMIALPLAPTIVNRCKEINNSVIQHKEVGRSEPTFPSVRIKARAVATYASARTEGVVSTAPMIDEHLGLIPRKKASVWSANVKKQRLASWQTLAHQSMGQLSLVDHFATLTQDILDEAGLPQSICDKAQGALGVLHNTLKAAQRGMTTLAAHLDLTAREADLRTLDISEVHEAELRSRPLFEGHTFGGLSRSEVLEMRTNRREEALLQTVSAANKAPKKGPVKKAQEKPSVTTPPESASRKRAPYRQGSRKGTKSKRTTGQTQSKSSK